MYKDDIVDDKDPNFRARSENDDTVVGECKKYR